MCGITGFVGQGNGEILHRMTGQLKHRGPDNEGYFFNGNVGLGHRRLSIIDLVGGQQPIFNEDKTVTVIFNGEIYNFIELRRELESRHNFVTNSDTEVIVHLYEELGEQVFKKLNGMFAIAIWDSRTNSLTLARDRLGKKPLYWNIAGGTLLFASELKALMQHPSFDKRLSLTALNKYLFYGYVPTPQTIFEDVYKLEPGSFLVFSNGRVRKGKFWDIEFYNNLNTSHSFGERMVLKELDQKINQAVECRLMSNVPLGIFLSGGLDSSTIAYYAQQNSKNKIKTFAVGFEEKSFDESGFASKVARFLGTEHYSEVLTAKKSFDLITNVASFLDEPLADASIIPTFFLSKLARTQVTVALGGDGGDELFSGYDTFKAHQLARVYEKLPVLIKKSIARVVESLPVSSNNFSLDFKLKRFVSGFDVPNKYRDQVWLSGFGHKAREKLFLPEVWQEIKNINDFEDIDNNLAGLTNEKFHNQLTYLYFRMYLMDQVLVKVDRASMANSLEVRSPFLDYQLVDYVNSLPDRFKVRSFKLKYILKKLMADKLPKEIVFRKKKGFGLPLSLWFNNELKGFVKETLSFDRIKQQGLFDYSYIDGVMEDHFSGRKDNRILIWSLLVYQMWHKKWMKNEI